MSKHKLPRLSQLTLAIAQLSLLPAVLPAAHAVEPNSAAIQRRYDIPAGPLEAALNRFGRDAGILLSFPTSLTAGRQSPGLQGSYTASTGLVRLLQGTGLAAEAREDGSYTLYKVPAAAIPGEATLAAIRVKARREGDGSTEGTGAYTSRVTSIASKTDMAFREIPQSVSVVTREQIEDQKLVDINDALKLMPGVTVNRMNDNSFNFYSRGFQITSMQIDGGAPLALGAYTYSPLQDMAFYDRVEVMRGASGLLGGMGDPGGIINLARKKPLAEAQTIVELSAGSWDNYRTMVDVSRPLTEAGHVRGRAVMLYENRDSHLDYRNTERPAVYGVIEADISPATLLTVGGSYNKRHENGTGDGLPRYADGRSLDLPRSASLTQPWAYRDSEEKEVFAQLAHRFANGWALKVNAAHSETETEAQTAFVGGPVDPATGLGTWAGGYYEYENRQDTVDLNLSGNFNLFERSHELLLGADWQRVRSNWMSATFPGHWSDPADIFHGGTWNPNRDTSLLSHTMFGPWGQEQTGAYGVVRLHPSDRLHVVAGARASRYKFEQRVSSKPNAAAGWTVTSNLPFSLATKITPYGGVIYDLSDNWSAYVSYAGIYKPQSLMLAGPPPGSGSLDPVEGKSYEAGFKGELMGGRLNATVSIFHVARTGTAILDRRYPPSNDAWAGNCCYLAQGEATSRGIDVEIGGELRPGWQAAIGYTFNQTRDKQKRDSFSGITPRHLLKLSTAYRLPGKWSQWKLGGNAHIQSKTYVTDDVLVNGTYQNQKLYESGYAVFNALLQYQLAREWTLALNVNNVFDRKYYERVGDTWSGSWYGTPRNAMLTLTWRH